MAGISSLVCMNNTICEAGVFHNPGELWEVMKRNLRQLSVDADAEAVSVLAIVLAHDFPSFAQRVSGIRCRFDRVRSFSWSVKSSALVC